MNVCVSTFHHDKVFTFVVVAGSDAAISTATAASYSYWTAAGGLSRNVRLVLAVAVLAALGRHFINVALLHTYHNEPEQGNPGSSCFC